VLQGQRAVESTMITTQHTQESLSLAYTHAVAGSAGVNLHVDRIFDYGVDGTFRPVILRDKRRVESGFPLDFQLKCTKNWSISDSNIVYKIETKTYNDLVTRTDDEIGIVLLLLCLPSLQSNWVSFCEDNFMLKNCCYYTKLSGRPVSNEKSTKQISIPRKNILDPKSLTTLLSYERSRKTGAAL
jgi:hypothetical protein